MPPTKKLRVEPPPPTLGARLQQAERAARADDEEDEEDEEAAHAQRLLASAPLGARLRAAADGGASAAGAGWRGRPGAPSTRENKNRPVEQSSRRPVARGAHAAVLPPPRAARDPRFDPPAAGAAAAAESAAFRKRYRFLFDEALPAERRALRAAAARERRPERADELRGALAATEQALAREAAARKAEAAGAAARKAERGAVAAGKAPFYPKKADAVRSRLLAQFEELKAAGRLDKFIATRRKKLAQKDHTLLPRAESRR
jgi:ribosomal RNA-processing protein 36